MEVVEKLGMQLKSYNDVDYVVIDFTGFDDEQLIPLTLEISAMLKQIGEGKARLITDLSGLGRGVNSYSFGRNFAKDHQKYLCKSAVIGVPVWLKPIYNIFMKFTGSKSKLFESKQLAVEFVCS